MIALSLDTPAAGVARLRLGGHLDPDGARTLLHAAADVARAGCLRLVVDLDGLASYDDEAAYAVVGCGRLGEKLPEGVEVVADGGPGRQLALRAGLAPGRRSATHAPVEGIMGPCPGC